MTADVQRAEINGDLALSLADRIRYLSRNLRRNIVGVHGAVAIRSWRPPAEAFAPPRLDIYSPTRGLTEAFIRHQLRTLLPAEKVSVLDVGCGSGRTCGLLAGAGYHGRYIGVDVTDRFEADKWSGDAFETRFVQGDAHTALLDGPFDLIVSISALEHVLNDVRLIARLEGLLAPGGLQVHFVPAPAALFTYLWHGYRQYGGDVIAERFGTETTEVYKLGGIASFALHLGFITLPEIFLRMSLRRRWPEFYKTLLGNCMRVDAEIPLLPSFYVVCRRTLSSDHEQRA